jgi:hypothetical protein
VAKNKWIEYEKLKAEARDKARTSIEYEAMCREIARKLKI